MLDITPMQCRGTSPFVLGNNLSKAHNKGSAEKCCLLSARLTPDDVLMIVAGLKERNFLRSYGKMIRDEPFDSHSASLKYAFEHDSALRAIS
jgi:hypothetical protein